MWTEGALLDYLKVICSSFPFTVLCQLAQKMKGPFSTLLGVSSPLSLLEPSHSQSPRTKSEAGEGRRLTTLSLTLSSCAPMQC